ncbi:MAG: hypothetical protein JWR22_2199 [Herminiimonas sp.]|nr:hypothetical protein [Herminiimonas sp.]
MGRHTASFHPLPINMLTRIARGASQFVEQLRKLFRHFVVAFPASYFQNQNVPFTSG